MHRLIELGVNIDHVATLRQARRTYEPDPVWAAAAAELGGADGITVHLREDRRHIQDRDLRLLKETVACKLNLELACDAGVVQIACETKPEQATLVPERREEVTTEGGLDLVGQLEPAKRSIGVLRDAGVLVSLFLDPDPRQLEIAFGLGVEAIELHTGQYALAKGEAIERELVRLVQAGESIVAAGVRLHAGHGLNYRNVRPVAAIPRMLELNIGHSIVSRSIFVGLTQAVREMKDLLLLEEKPDA